MQSAQMGLIFWNYLTLGCVHSTVMSTLQVNRPLVVGVTVGMAKLVAGILEYSAWVLSMGHKYRECVCSSFAENQSEWSA